MTYGVILARFQPIHNGHLALIKKACSENDKVIILIGSADKLNKRNPIPIGTRIALVKNSLEKENLLDKCIIKPLNDLTTESDNSVEWGFYLYAKLVEISNFSRFTFYYSDGFEIITTWFPPHIMRNYVSLSLLARGSIEKGISATIVRNKILTDSSDLKEIVPESVFDIREILKSFILITS